ncbi:MAG: AI-2E family transporter [Lachnospiraceae bacterium]|nr:AI-2E family transporter [Lachnospiraceae bacterium]
MKTRYLLLLITALVLLLAFRFLLPLTLPFVLAYFFAKMISPVIHFLTDRLKWTKKVSSIMVVLVMVFAIGGFVIYIISIVIGQAILLLQRLPVYEQEINYVIEEICGNCDRMLELTGGTSYEYIEAQTEILYRNIGNDILPKLSSCAIYLLRFAAEIVSGAFIFLLSTLLILLDDTFPAVHRKLKPVAKKLKAAGFAYIKAQGIIIFVIAAITSLGLILMGNEYAVLFGIGIAVFDAFPIVGSGIILVPWGFVRMLSGDFYEAAILFTIFAVATFFREILEPRLLGKEIGMKPLFVLLSVYVGVKLFHVSGILLGPIALTILKTVNDMLKMAETEDG